MELHDILTLRKGQTPLVTACVIVIVSAIVIVIVIAIVSAIIIVIAIVMATVIMSEIMIVIVVVSRDHTTWTRPAHATTSATGST
jgi:hypothetical protein